MSHTWRSLAVLVARDKEHRRDADDFLLNLQPAPDPHFAAITKVDVPHPTRLTEIVSFEASERNVFCGPYSVITVDGARKEVGRTAHYAGGEYVLFVLIVSIVCLYLSSNCVLWYLSIYPLL